MLRIAQICKVKLTLRDRAIQKISDINRRSSSRKALRASIEAGGCSGFLYKFELVPEGSFCEYDFVVTRDSCSVYIDKASSVYLDNSEIDFKSDMARETFQIVKNNVSAASCGCGSSFSLEN